MKSINLISRVFANGPGDRGSILDRVIPKTEKLVLDAASLNTQHYKVRVKWSNPGMEVRPPLHLVFVAIEKGSIRSPSSKVAKFTILSYI